MYIKSFQIKNNKNTTEYQNPNNINNNIFLFFKLLFMQTQHKHVYTHQKNYHFQRRRISFFVKVQSLITFTLLLFFSMNQNNHNAGEIHISFKNYLPTLDLCLFKTLKCFYFNRKLISH